MTVQAPSETGRGGDDSGHEAVVIYHSRLKALLLSLPLLALSAGGVHSWYTGGGASLTTAVALLAVGIGCAATLVWMGFEKSPVLRFDAAGIHCRSPDIGLIPWSGITGLGLGRTMLLQSALMVAVDDSELSEQVQEKVRRYGRGGLFARAPKGAIGQFGQGPTVQIPIGMLAISTRRLRQVLQQQVDYAGSR